MAVEENCGGGVRQASIGTALAGSQVGARIMRLAGLMRRDLPPPMAQTLGISVDELLGETEKKRRAGAGPTGRMRRLFEAAFKLPRSQQEKIAAVIEAFVNQHSDREV